MPNINLNTSDSTKDYTKKALIGEGIGLAAGAASAITGVFIESYNEARRVKQAQQLAAQAEEQQTQAFWDKVLDDAKSGSSLVIFLGSTLEEKRTAAISDLSWTASQYTKYELVELINLFKTGSEAEINKAYQKLLDNLAEVARTKLGYKTRAERAEEEAWNEEYPVRAWLKEKKEGWDEHPTRNTVVLFLVIIVVNIFLWSSAMLLTPLAIMLILVVPTLLVQVLLGTWKSCIVMLILIPMLLLIRFS